MDLVCCRAVILSNGLPLCSLQDFRLSWSWKSNRFHWERLQSHFLVHNRDSGDVGWWTRETSTCPTWLPHFLLSSPNWSIVLLKCARGKVSWTAASCPWHHVHTKNPLDLWQGVRQVCSQVLSELDQTASNPAGRTLGQQHDRCGFRMERGRQCTCFLVGVWGGLALVSIGTERK